MSGTWSFGSFTLDFRERSLRASGKPVELGPRAFDLLAVLVARAGTLVTKNELLDTVWAGRVVEENNLQVQVSALRKALGPDAIVTLPGRGYRFALAVEKLGRPAEELPRVAEPSSAPSSSLPRVGHSIFGREADLSAIVDEVRAHSLVTLTGAGGVGKTRLAEVVSRNLRATFKDGVAWVDLGSLADPGVLTSAVALGLGLDPAAGVDVMDAVLGALRRQSLLLVLDNAEHLLGAVAKFAQRLMRECPDVRQLVTSQAPLKIPGERVYHLDPLEVPDAVASVEEAARCAAVELFVQRAKDADRRFVLDASSVGAVNNICRRLEGIPLALELAAARVPGLGLQGIEARISERFRLLAQSGRQGPSRQQTLHAAFEWSHQLLSEQERKVFRRLSLFVGPFSVQQATAVAADDGLDEWDVIDHLGALIERSFVTAGTGDEPRYRLLESARAYALEQLSASPEPQAISRVSRLYEAAGDAAAAESRNGEAVLRYSAALETARLSRVAAERDARELSIYLKLGPAVQTAASPGSRQCETIYAQAVALARQVGTIRDQFLATWGYWHFLCMAGREREAAEYLDGIDALASQSQDDGLVVEASHASLTTQQLLGNAWSVVRHAERLLELYDPGRHRDLRYAFGGHDPGICAASQASIAFWLAGRPDRALSMASHALTLAGSVQHAYSEAAAYYYAAMTYWACGEKAEFARVSHALTAVSERHSMDILLTEGKLFEGRAAFESGSQKKGIGEMRDAVDRIDASGETSFMLFYSALLADALMATDQLEEAEARLQCALAVTAGGQGFFLPEVHRLRGELHMRRGNQVAGREDFAAAMRIAHEQGSASLALRAAASMTEPAIIANEPEPSRTLLAAALERIEGGSSTRDVKRARALLGSRR